MEATAARTECRRLDRGARRRRHLRRPRCGRLARFAHMGRSQSAPLLQPQKREWPRAVCPVTSFLAPEITKMA
jgi:hypothetical protein